MSKLHELHEAGQSVWLDFIRREMLEDGELTGLVADGIRGLTSNPTIFQKAISGSTAYDAGISDAMGADHDATPETVFEDLAIADIQAAADILAPVYQDSNSTDGLVSLEVSPHLAADTAGTMANARRLWAKVNRPNLMIKVPATPEGIPAIEDLIASGINVNATLMFSLADYEAVAQAYVRGVARAADPARVASVASFFVSRVDNMTDAALEKLGTDDALALRGKAAVANAKLAYARYKQIFASSEFAPSRERGAHPQRVLWASTSTKNPAYSDVLYVEPLVGPNTVNTMPPATIEAFCDHGTIDPTALSTDVATARAEIEALDDLGVDFDDITATLQVDGVKAFADSYDDLLSAVGDKMRRLS